MYTEDYARKDPTQPAGSASKDQKPVTTVQSGATANASAGSDPIYGSLGPAKCDEKDFANEEQKLIDKMRNSKP